MSRGEGKRGWVGGEERKSMHDGPRATGSILQARTSLRGAERGDAAGGWAVQGPTVSCPPPPPPRRHFKPGAGPDRTQTARWHWAWWACARGAQMKAAQMLEKHRYERMCARSAMAPETMVDAVAAKFNWKKKYAHSYP